MTRSHNKAWLLSIPGLYAVMAFLVGLIVFAGAFILNWRWQPPGSNPSQVATQPWMWWLATLPFSLAVIGYWVGKGQEAMVKVNYQIELDLAQCYAELVRNTQEREHESAERQRAERIISRGKLEWEATFDAVSDSILITDLYGMIIRCNRSATQHMHTTYNELIGRSIDEAFFGELLTGQTRFPTQAEEAQFPAFDGWCEVASYPLMVEGVTQGMIYTLRDITERKRARAETLLQIQSAEQTSSLKTIDL